MHTDAEEDNKVDQRVLPFQSTAALELKSECWVKKCPNKSLSSSNYVTHGGKVCHQVSAAKHRQYLFRMVLPERFFSCVVFSVICDHFHIYQHPHKHKRWKGLKNHSRCFLPESFSFFSSPKFYPNKIVLTLCESHNYFTNKFLVNSLYGK